MIQNVERIDDLFFIKLTGEITESDVQYVKPMLEKIIVDCKKVKLVIQFENVTGCTMGSFFADFMFYFKYMNIIKSIAFVGMPENQVNNAKKFGKFFHCNMNFFDYFSLEDAKNWVKQF